MTRLAIWPCAIPMDYAGKSADDFQGIYSRGLCRAFAEGLLRPRLCEVAVCLPIVEMGDVTSWAVTGREWNIAEVLEKASKPDADFVMSGTMSIATRVELHLSLISRSDERRLIDRHWNCPRMELLNCLSDVVTALGESIVGRSLNAEEDRELRRWGTRESESYLAYLEAWSAAAAFRYGVSIPDPKAAAKCARRVSEMDPSFIARSRIEEFAGELQCGDVGPDGNVLVGYSECAFLIGEETGTGKAPVKAG